MSIVKCVSSNFNRISILFLLFSFVASSVVNYSNPLTDPCFGHKDGRARAINLESSIGSCSEFFECLNGVRTTVDPYRCLDQPYFDAETEQCVGDPNVCFQCSYYAEYELLAVPNAPVQFIQCFKQKSVLLACQEDLEFDNRIQQCNAKRLCRSKDLTGRRCKMGGPYYEIDNFDPSV